MGGKHIQRLQMPRKLIDHFEKAMGLSQIQAHKIPRDKEEVLSLVHLVTCSPCTLMHSLPIATGEQPCELRHQRARNKLNNLDED